MKREGKRWDDNEIRFLKDNYVKMSNEELAEELERNINAVKSKATELGLFDLRRRKVDFNLEEWQKIYLAGLIDGEGWIGFATQRSYPQPTVRIANKNPKLLKINNWFEGESYIYEEKGENDYGYQKISFTRQAPILKLLREIKPYLIFKKDQADLVIQYIQSRFDKSANRPINEDERKIAKKCHELNQRLRGAKIVEA